MDVEYRKFIKEVKDGKVRSAYLLLGENNFLKETLARDIEAKIITPEFEVTDKLVVYGKNPPQDMISWLLSPPFGSKKKLLIIKDAEQLLPSLKVSIQRWLDNPTKTAVLVLMSKNRDFKNIGTCNCWKLSEKEIPEWVKSFVKERGFDIEPKTIGFLQQIFGRELQMLSTELEKLMNFVEPRKVITLKDAEKIELRELTGSIFDLTHAVGKRDFVKARPLLELLFDLGESPSNILWMLYRHFDKLFKLKENPDEEIGIHKYYLPKYKRQADLWAEKDLLNCFSSLFEADFAIKTGKAKSGFVLLELIYKLCGGGV